MTTGPERTPADLGDLLTTVSGDARGWLHAQRDLTLLIVSEKAAQAGRAAIGGFVGFVILGAALTMLSVAGAFAWGHALGSVAHGFLYVGLIDLGVLLLFMIWWRTSLGDRITLSIINSFHVER
ncbi:MAG: phage holin family protein [Flavobacteriales bacterium]|nr:phage holin family protein [Flavobacteriales bacterium]